jgi:hypothetical protein
MDLLAPLASTREDSSPVARGSRKRGREPSGPVAGKKRARRRGRGRGGRGSGSRGPRGCFDFRAGHCHRGAACKFEHGDGGNGATTAWASTDHGRARDRVDKKFHQLDGRDVCVKNALGRCSRGADCAYAHPAEGSAHAKAWAAVKDPESQA